MRSRADGRKETPVRPNGRTSTILVPRLALQYTLIDGLTQQPPPALQREDITIRFGNGIDHNAAVVHLKHYGYFSGDNPRLRILIVHDALIVPGIVLVEARGSEAIVGIWLGGKLVWWEADGFDDILGCRGLRWN